MSKPRVIYWFRTDLRLHDSPALKAALDLKPEVLYPIWCWDSHYVYRARVGVNRWQFLIDCQNDVSESITKLNKKSKLFVLREPAVTLLPKLFKAWKISHLVFEKDTDAYARERDEKVMELAKEAGVKVITKVGRTLYDPDAIVKANGGKPTMSIKQLQAAAEKVGEVEKPVETPKSLPAPGDMTLRIKVTEPDTSPDINSKFRTDECITFSSGIAGPQGDFSPATLEELGMKPATTPHRGGETLILKRLEEIFTQDSAYAAQFEKPRTSPAAFEPQSTFLTSPSLHFGALSVRYFYHRVSEIIEKRKQERKATSSPPESLIGQLQFRDMYFAAQAAGGYHFGQTLGNANCRFVPWHLPSKIDPVTQRITGEYEVDDEEKEVWLKRWREGKTGFPWIDAIMRQLRCEGWIHHLARHSVACFLTRGGCYISWERGLEVFEEFLIDHESACNVGNWQWLSCTAFFAQFYRCYSPVAFGRKWDENGDYIRKFVPELKDVPKKFIFEPWKAPIVDLKKAGVRIEGDGMGGGEGEKDDDAVKVYPKPMFDFNERRKICIDGMKNAYDVGLYGNHDAVLDGSWKEKFADGAEGPTEGKKGGPAGLESWEDADGHEEAEPDMIKSDEKPGPSSKGKSGSTRAGHKREASQSTLDGAFGKKRAK